MFFSKKKLIGLDIGSHSIKMAELDVSRRSATLQSFGLIATPPQATSSGDIINPGLIAESVQSLLREMGTKRANVATGLWGTSVVVKKISVPKMEENLIAEQIRWEAEQYIPFDINDVNLDFRILKTSKNAETMDLLLIAALREAILKSVEAVEMSKLSCDVLDVNGFALANTFLHGSYNPKDSPVGIFNIGANATNFIVIEQGEIIFCRDLPTGGALYTSEIQKSMGLSTEEAENMKITICNGQPGPEEVSSIIQSTHDVLVEELGGAIDFFTNTNQGMNLSAVYLTGGAVRTTGLAKRVESRYPCKILDPFANIKINEKKISPSYLASIRDFAAIAVGLGLRGETD